MATYDLCGFPSEDRKPRPIGRADDAVDPDDDLQVAREISRAVAFERAPLDQVFEFIARTAEDFAGFDDVLDVGTGVVPADDSAGVVLRGMRAAEHPSILTGAMTQPILDVVGLAGRQRVAPHRPGALLIVGMEMAFQASPSVESDGTPVYSYQRWL